MAQKMPVPQIRLTLADAEGDARRAFEKIEDLSKQLDNRKAELEIAVQNHTQLRRKLFETLLNEQHRAFCTGCGNLFSEAELHLYFIDQTVKTSGGYENSCYGFENVRTLHCGCGTCKEEAFVRHGYVGPWDRSAHDQERYQAYTVEKRDDGLYVLKYGHEEKLDESDYRLSTLASLSASQIDNHAEEFGLPPRIELQNGKLVILKNPTTALV